MAGLRHKVRHNFPAQSLGSGVAGSSLSTHGSRLLRHGIENLKPAQARYEPHIPFLRLLLQVFRFRDKAPTPTRGLVLCLIFALLLASVYQEDESARVGGWSLAVMAVSKPLLHPPLSEVAFEVNFPRQFLVENRIAEYQSRVSENYPYSNDEFVVRLPPVIAFGKPPKPGVAGLTPVRSFVFQNPTGSRTIKVSVVNLSFIVTDYRHFEDYKNALLAVLIPAIEIFGLHRVERLGLRYINKIAIPLEQGPVGYRGYVRSPIDLSAFPGQKLGNFLNEVRLELDKKKNLTIRSGLLPTEAETSSRTYLLDFDCYSEETTTLTKQDLASRLDEYHEVIEAEFKRALTEKYWNYIERGEQM